MGKRERRTFTEEFKPEAVRLTETSGRTIAQVAEDLGLGLSTLNSVEEAIPGSGSIGRPTRGYGQGTGTTSQGE